MNACSIRMAMIGLFPYALVQITDAENSQADVELGGFNTSDPAEVALMARALRSTAKALRKRHRALLRARIAERWAEFKDARK